MALVLFSMTARADTTNLDLTWEAPAGCASQAEIIERVARLLGDGTRARQSVRARAIVGEAADHQYRADLELASGGEAGAHRIVEGESCPAVADAVVTIVALAIDPEAAVSAPAAPPPPPPPPPRAERAPRPLELSVGASGRVDVGSLPSAAVGGQAIVGASYYSIGVELDGSLLASARRPRRRSSRRAPRQQRRAPRSRRVKAQRAPLLLRRSAGALRRTGRRFAVQDRVRARALGRGP